MADGRRRHEDSPGQAQRRGFVVAEPQAVHVKQHFMLYIIEFHCFMVCFNIFLRCFYVIGDFMVLVINMVYSILW